MKKLSTRIVGSFAALAVVALAGVALGDGGAKAEQDEFVAEMKSSGACKVNTECGVDVFVTPKGDYHVNDKYPYGFKFDAADGVKFTKDKIEKADVKIEEKKASFHIAFTPSKTGSVTISGKLKLGVCASGNCVEGRPALSLSVDVK